MRALAITGMLTAFWISRIFFTGDIRATPPSLRMSDGARSRAITDAAPASSAILAWSAWVTSMITPPLSISASAMCLRSAIRSSFGSVIAFSFFDVACAPSDDRDGGALGQRAARPAAQGLAHGLAETLDSALDV